VVIRLTVTGTNDLAKALERLAARGESAARPAAEAMAAVAERQVKKTLSASSHPRGTRTPSSPGMPPSLITGQLRRSVRRTRSEGGAGRWETRVAPTTVYARIQELGGTAGRGHRSRLPARPYVRPALAASREQMRQAAVRAFRRALEGA
jgi:phage gpG-like protein